jgi:hypothetical protein
MPINSHNQRKYSDNFWIGKIAIIGDIYFTKYLFFVIVSFDIMHHLCSVENRSYLMSLIAWQQRCAPHV